MRKNSPKKLLKSTNSTDTESDKNDDDDDKNEEDPNVEENLIDKIDNDGKSKKSESEFVRKSKEDDEEIAKFMKLKCDFCSDEFIIFAEIKRHYRIQHNMKGYVICCSKKFHKRVYLLDHVRMHVNPECFKCYECNKTFRDRRGLQTHILYHHESEDNKIYKCDQCPKSYAKLYTLNYHKRIHIAKEERHFYCELCQKSFATYHTLLKHRRHIHENFEGHMCDICARVIRDKGAFKNHMLQHTGIVEPKIQCKECGIWLKNIYSFRKHVKRHAEISDEHVCNVCGKVTPTKSLLQRHVKYVHSLERTFKCSLCPKAFKRSLNLKEHMTTHTGEVLYTCPHCPKTFNSNANMHSHRKKAHPKEWEEGRRQRLGFGFNPETSQNEITNTLISQQEITYTN